jgi:N-acetylgalactosamine kinase
MPGLDLLVRGTVPAAAGLSSSSALVVATALAYLAALDRPVETVVPRIELAQLLAEAEQFVGTRGGGMDQAIILLGKQGHACKIDFAPLRAECMPVFDGCVFVACNSLVKAEKTGDARHRYNAGPLSCRLITALVERQAREEFGEDFTLDRLGELWSGALCLTFEEAESLFERALPAERMPLAEAATRLHLSEDEVRARYLGDLPEPPGGYPLRARARHQLGEHRRVQQARDALLAGDPETFGDLMNGSHASCAGDYAVSCPELDALAQAARDAGALGARMTGAGFGGCTVNLVPEDRLDPFLEHVDRAYYREHLGLDGGAPAEAMFPVRSSDGAQYLEDGTPLT